MANPVLLLVGGTKILEGTLRDAVPAPQVVVGTIEEAMQVLDSREVGLVVFGPTLRRSLAMVSVLRRDGRTEPKLLVVYPDALRDEVKRHLRGRPIADRYITQSRTGKDLAASEQMIALIAPALFGLTLELSAFAVAMLGWHPTRQPLPLLLPAENVAANVSKHPVIAALERARRPVNNSELAKLMNVCNGEATKRRREVANVINVQRIGRECMISLKAGACSL